MTIAGSLLALGAGDHLPEGAQGAVFARRAGEMAGPITEHNEQAARICRGRSADSAARIAAECVVDLPGRGSEPEYEVFRCRERPSPPPAAGGVAV